MRNIDNRPLVHQDTSGGDPWRIRTVRPVAMLVAMIVAIMSPIILAVPVWLSACSLIELKPPEAAADRSPPIATEPISGPIALAPSMTGAAPPARPSAPVPAQPLTPPTAPAATVAIPAPPPGPATALAMPAPPPAPAAAVAIPAAAPAPCPAGSIAMWSEPDAAGTPVPICRRLDPPR